MKCERCHQKDATVFFEQTVNGESKSMHLCHDCAAVVKKEGFFEAAPFSLGGNLFGDLFGFAAPARVASAKKTCPLCGADFATIRREGKVACPRCYETFAEELEPTVRSLHGKVTHTGRAPLGHRAARDKQNKLAALRDALKKAIDEEQYEEAARLRDEIRALEKEEN